MRRMLNNKTISNRVNQKGKETVHRREYMLQWKMKNRKLNNKKQMFRILLKNMNYLLKRIPIFIQDKWDNRDNRYFITATNLSNCK